jgi:hypothetical protein
MSSKNKKPPKADSINKDSPELQEGSLKDRILEYGALLFSKAQPLVLTFSEDPDPEGTTEKCIDAAWFYQSWKDDAIQGFIENNGIGEQEPLEVIEWTEIRNLSEKIFCELFINRIKGLHNMDDHEMLDNAASDAAYFTFIKGHILSSLQSSQEENIEKANAESQRREKYGRLKVVK